ncbi:hypothetical protein LXL04_005787 [Taraxacum kok-saghyz]
MVEAAMEFRFNLDSHTITNVDKVSILNANPLLLESVVSEGKISFYASTSTLPLFARSCLHFHTSSAPASFDDDFTSSDFTSSDFTQVTKRLKNRLTQQVMSRLIRRRKVVVAFWNQVMVSVIWFFITLCNLIAKYKTTRPRIRGLAINTDRFKIMHRYAYKSDSLCLSQLRMNMRCFAKLCCMLETLGGLKATVHMNVDEQVAIFLHMIAHNVKNRVLTEWTTFRDNLAQTIVNRCGTVESPEVWDAYVKVHKGAEKWRNKPIPHYDDLCIIFGKDRAQGNRAEDCEDKFKASRKIMREPEAVLTFWNLEGEDRFNYSTSFGSQTCNRIQLQHNSITTVFNYSRIQLHSITAQFNSSALQPTKQTLICKLGVCTVHKQPAKCKPLKEADKAASLPCSSASALFCFLLDRLDSIDGATFKGPECCSTLKDAEHAAAKVAFMALSPDGTQEVGFLSYLFSSLR